MAPNPSNRLSLQVLALSLAAGMIPFVSVPAVANQVDGTADAPSGNDEPQTATPRPSSTGDNAKTLHKVSTSVSTRPVTVTKPQSKPEKPAAPPATQPKPAPAPHPDTKTPAVSGEHKENSTSSQSQSNPIKQTLSQTSGGSVSTPERTSGDSSQQAGAGAKPSTPVDVFAPDTPGPTIGSKPSLPDGAKPTQPDPSDRKPNPDGRPVPQVPELWDTPPPSRLPSPAPGPITDDSATSPESPEGPGAEGPNQPQGHPADGETSEQLGEPPSPEAPGGYTTDDSNPGSAKPDRLPKPTKPVKPSEGRNDTDHGTKRPDTSAHPDEQDDRENQPEQPQKPGDNGPGSTDRTEELKPHKPDTPAPSHPAITPAPSSSRGDGQTASRPSGSSGQVGSSASTSHSTAPARPSKPQASTTISAVLPAPDAPVASASTAAQSADATSSPAVGTTTPTTPDGSAISAEFTVRHPALLAVTVTHPNTGEAVGRTNVQSASSYVVTPVVTAKAGVVSHGHAQLVQSRQQPVSPDRITQWLDAVQEDLQRRASGQEPTHTLWSAEAVERPELGSTWTIKAGDTAWSIARALWGEDVSWSVMESTWITLVAWNPELAKAVPHHLPEGVTIIIPADIPTPTDA